MQNFNEFTTMRSLLEALAKSLNLINPIVEHHHEQTAYLSYMLSRQLGIPQDGILHVMYGALLHDIGAVDFEDTRTVNELDRKGPEIAKHGANMIREFDEMRNIADIIEFCQCSWIDIQESIHSNEKKFYNVRYKQNLEAASIVHLADKVSVMINPQERILNQVDNIKKIVDSYSGTDFSPVVVEAFDDLSKNEFIWLDLLKNPSFLLRFTGDIRPVSLDETVRFSGLMSKIIDFRSPFTAMHSAGVAASAKTLARLAGMNEAECKMMEIAGSLHDVGKLVVPKQILEKPGRLTDEEFNIIKEHPYYTRLILMNIDGFEKIADWAGLHHEKLNGRGYPFHFDANTLDKGSRILAVADIFSAITEVRPYRKGMDREQVLKIMKENTERGDICKDIVTILYDNYDEVNAIRDKVSKERGQRYFSSLDETNG